MDTLGAQPRPADELAGLRARRDALRQAAGLPDADVRPTLDAALAELDAAIDALADTARPDQATPPGESDHGEPGELRAERRLLRAAFHDAPVPLFLLELDGTIRRANRSAGDLLGTGTGYTTGRPFTAFVDLPSRAAAHSQLAALARTGRTRRFRCELLTHDGGSQRQLTATLARQRGDADQIVVAVGAADGPQDAPDPPPGEAHAARAAPMAARMARRLDLVTAVTRLLLENPAASEAVTLQRCARLLAEEFAAWVMVDLAQGRGLRRQIVVGPDQDHESAELARAVAACPPHPDALPGVVHATGGAQLLAHAQDVDVLGDGPGGLPLLMALGATSVLCVPLAAGQRVYGAMTLARHAGGHPFALADLGLVEELGEQFALAIGLDRELRRHTQIADALRESLVPRRPPGLPGADLAIAHLDASATSEVGGDFCDVFRGASGWGFAIGDVCGRGGGVAAASAAARHAIRVVAYSLADPGDVLARANDLMLAEDFEGRFVTACVATAEQRGESLRVTLATAGHPPPLLVRGDGRTERLSEGGLPLGIFCDLDTRVESCDLADGDTLVLFTDGLTDSRGSASGLFADRLLGEAAALSGQPARELAARLQESAVGFSGGDIRDDITILAVRATGRPAAATE